jgi:D-alanine transaminase
MALLIPGLLPSQEHEIVEGNNAVTSTAYINGDFLPLADARVSVLDRGFLFADGVYEVTVVIDGKLVDSAAHLARLRRSAGEIDIAVPLSDAELIAAHRELIARNGLTEGLIYLQLTRGADDRRDFLTPASAAPTLVMFAQAKAVVDMPATRTGFAVKTVPDLRWARRDIKSVALLAQVIAKREAAAAGCQEAWMIEDGAVTEGASSTAFILNADNVLITRPDSHSVLPGCTALAVAALAAEQDLVIDRRAFTVAEALAAREAFITSASTLVMPVVSIDNAPVGDGRPGPLAARLRRLYIERARATAI